MPKLRCAIRGIDLEDNPEERVRQQFLSYMMDTLGYPSSLLSVEQELSLLPHLTFSKEKIPDRRADIICYGKGIHPDYQLYPLLLVECKAIPLTAKALNQVSGYNHFIKAYFIAIVNQNELRCGWFHSPSNSYQFVSGLPHYNELIKAARIK